MSKVDHPNEVLPKNKFSVFLLQKIHILFSVTYCFLRLFVTIY